MQVVEMSQEFISRSEHLRRKRAEQRKKNRLKQRDWMQVLLIAIVLAVVIRIFVIAPSMVSGPSMQKTMESGDLVLVNKLLYLFRQPERGEIIVFEVPGEEDLIKRVIALPGETIEAKNQRIYINGKELKEPYLDPKMVTMDFAQVKIPPDHVFAMGDNRMNSKDSRSLGAISYDRIVGRADLIYWPLSHFKFLW
jgi:signal peptidase I